MANDLTIAAIGTMVAVGLLLLFMSKKLFGVDLADKMDAEVLKAEVEA